MYLIGRVLNIVEWVWCVWLGSVAVRAGLAINRWRVQLPAAALPSSDPGQVVHTCPAPLNKKCLWLLLWDWYTSHCFAVGQQTVSQLSTFSRVILSSARWTDDNLSLITTHLKLIHVLLSKFSCGTLVWNSGPQMARTLTRVFKLLRSELPH